MYRCPVPVVSIGNLTMGGTGKTPLVEHVARLLQTSGWQPAVVSRGYGGQSKARVNLVSNGQEILLPAEMAGDEPRLLADKLPGVPVLTGPVRKLPMQKAVEMGADAVILDDGFQHLSVARDINMVLFNTNFLAGNSRVFPGGHLREPVAALHRATAFVMTNVQANNQERAKGFKALLEERFPGKDVFFSGYTLVGLVHAKTGEIVQPETLQGKRFLGLCGIARPEAFASSLTAAGIKVAHTLNFRDHVTYTTRIMNKIEQALAHYQPEALITTEKDMVKLRNLQVSPPLYALRMRATPDTTLDSMIVQHLAQERGLLEQ